MLLRNLSARARADIERTNRGEEKPERDAPREDKPVARDRSNPKNPARSGAIDPTQADSLSENFLTSFVSAQDSMSDQKRHDTGYMHLSEMLRGFCARKIRLLDESGERAYESPTGGHRVMWLIGRAVEKHIRDSYIKAVKGKGVIGKWVCKCEQTSYEGLYQHNARACPFCRVAPSEYQELTFTDHEAGVRGNPDMLAHMTKDNKVRVIEVKSMNSDDFDELEAAVPDHIYQAAGYRRLLEANGYDVSETVIIVYCTKKFKFGKPYKEFHVDVSVESIQAVLDGAWEKAELLRQARIDNVIPPRTECAGVTSPQAKKCQCVTDCFQRA